MIDKIVFYATTIVPAAIVVLVILAVMIALMV